MKYENAIKALEDDLYEYVSIFAEPNWNDGSDPFVVDLQDAIALLRAEQGPKTQSGIATFPVSPITGH